MPMRSLRSRLTLGLSLVLAGVLAVAGLLFAAEVERDQRSTVDDRLRRTAELSRATAARAVQEELPGGDDRLDAVLSATRTSLRLVLAGTTLYSTGDEFPVRARLRDGFSTVTVRGVRHRAYAIEVDDPDLGGLVRLELTTALTAVEDRQARLERRLALLGLGAVLAAALLVWLASSLVLRPLARLRAATAAIADSTDLDRRVPAGGPSELRSLAQSFNEMLARLGRSSADRERALAATRRFAADAGHELRTPLTSAQATLSSLARHPDLPAERRVGMAEDARASLRRLVALLDGLQVLARGDAPAADEPIDLVEVVGEALAGVRERHPEIAWEDALGDAPVVVSGWAPGLRSIADNLLENAARHGTRDGSGRVRVSIAPGPVLVVEDDGPGVPEELRTAIFEPFCRGGLDEASEGSGLGLAIVAQQAAHHRASVDVGASPELGGARFSLRFPPDVRA